MTRQPDVLVNGRPVLNVPVSDRGIAYGDGVFETLLCIRGAVPLWHRHLARLEFACDTLGLPAPSRELWEHDLRTLLDGTGDLDRCVIKLTVTRGSGGFGYAPPDPCEPTRIVQLLEYPAAGDEDGLDCGMLATCLGSNRQLAGIKHLNRLEQVLAAQEMRAQNLHEGLVCNQYGFLIEAVSSNVIVVFGDRVVTPKLDTAGVRGVMRDLLIDATKNGKCAIVKDFVHSDVVHQADEIILCNSVRGVRRVRQLGSRPLTRRIVFDELFRIADLAFKGGV